MDFIEVEGKTYEEAVKKASLELKVDEKDLEIDVKEVDTKGILGLLGSKKVRITARIKKNENYNPSTLDYIENGEQRENLNENPEDYGKKFLQDVGKFIDLDFNIKVENTSGRIVYMIQCDHGDVMIGKNGETLEALQFILRLAIAKRFKQGLKLLIEINGYREKRKKALAAMAKQLANKVRRTGKPQKTDFLNPYERRIIHTFFKHNKFITTKSEGQGHTKRVVISQKMSMNGKR
ncbi:MAG: Jag N-terminal domain-containing protein [Syntrophorhabdaceae bacterium]|nr:Jag N-terminal domain-containing protein [Syntrophorhabdaceae bacterium]